MLLGHELPVRGDEQPQGRYVDEGGARVTARLDAAAGDGNRQALLSLEVRVRDLGVHLELELRLPVHVIRELPGQVMPALLGRRETQDQWEVGEVESDPQPGIGGAVRDQSERRRDRCRQHRRRGHQRRRRAACCTEAGAGSRARCVYACRAACANCAARCG